MIDKFKQIKEYSSLTDNQKRFFEAFFNRRNIFLTGPAGGGKSYCIKILAKFCAENNIPLSLTASTGIAALNIKGTTIHSFMGLGLANKDVHYIIKDIQKYKKAQERIKRCSRLFIDEVSMISGELLTKIDEIFKFFRPWAEQEPFGGVQIILCGDPLQLPPVFKGFANEEQSFFFESPAFEDAIFTTVYLNESKRQSEKDFIDALNKIRIGDCDGLNVIKKQYNYVFPKSSIQPVKLFSINSFVDKYNQSCLDNIKEKSVFFYARDDGEERHIQNLDKNCLAPKVLELKLGAQCLLLSNLDIERGFVNGTIGKIIKFENNLPVLQNENGDSLIIDNQSWEINEQIFNKNGSITYKSVASRKQIPLKLGYALSIHKSQGQTINKVEIDFGRTFEEGQVYVALSRATNLNSLSIKNLQPDMVKTNFKCLDFDKKMQQMNDIF